MRSTLTPHRHGRCIDLDHHPLVTGHSRSPRSGNPVRRYADACMKSVRSRLRARLWRLRRVYVGFGLTAVVVASSPSLPRRPVVRHYSEKLRASGTSAWYQARATWAKSAYGRRSGGVSCRPAPASARRLSRRFPSAWVMSRASVRNFWIFVSCSVVPYRRVLSMIPGLLNLSVDSASRSYSGPPCCSSRQTNSADVPSSVVGESMGTAFGPFHAPDGPSRAFVVLASL